MLQPLASRAVLALAACAPLLACTVVAGCTGPRPAGEVRFEVVTLEHATAPDLSAQMGRLLANLHPDAGRVTFDERTNSLIVAGDPAAVERLLAVVEALDREVR